MKVSALDIGDAWTGIAISDPSAFLARPFNTITSAILFAYLKDFFPKEKVSICVVGYPKTMKGTESDQTKKVVEIFEKLKEVFPEIEWVLQDERLSSKFAMQQKSKKDDKLKEHSVAAAFILESYLNFKNREILI